MFANVKESFTVINFLVVVTIFNLLNVSILTDGDISYAIELKLTNISKSSDEISTISTHSNIQSYIKERITDEEETFLLENFLSIKPAKSEMFSLEDLYKFTNSRILSVERSGVFHINYTGIEDTQYNSFTPIENDVFLPATSIFDRTYKVTEISFKNPDIAILERDSPISVSSRSLNNVKLDQFKFEPIGGLLILVCLFLSKRYLRK